MNANSSSEENLNPELDALNIFVQRAIRLGIEDVNGLADLIPDPEVQKQLRKVAEVNPSKGREESVDDLVAEMEVQAFESLASLDERV